MVQQAIDVGNETHDYTALEKLLMLGFSSVEALNGSFPLGLTKMSYSRPGISFDDLTAFYSLIASLPTEKPSELILTMAIALLKRPRRKLSTPSDIYFLLIILENPALYSPTIFASSKTHTSTDSLALSVLERCIGILAHSPNRTRHYLLNWVSRFPEPQFQRKVELLNSYVAHRLFTAHNTSSHKKHDRSLSLFDADNFYLHASSPSEPNFSSSAPSLSFASNGSERPRRTQSQKTKSRPRVKFALSFYGRDWRIMAFGTIQAIFFNANVISAKLPISTFYNSVVDLVDLKADCDGWERLGVPTSLLQTHAPSATHSMAALPKLQPLDNTGSLEQAPLFAFCQFPFFLSLASKKYILEYNARRQMGLEVHEAFFNSLSNQGVAKPYLNIRVHRYNLLQDSFDIFETHEEDLKKAIRVEFIGEAGIDAGGLKKEWFLLLARELFDPERRLFAEDEDSKYCWFNTTSQQPLKFYKLAGVALGLALYNSTNLDINFPPGMYKRLLGCPYNLKDFKTMWPRFGKSLQDLLDYEGNDIENTFCLTFSVTRKVEGSGVVEEPLIPNGLNRPVTKANRSDYVKRVVTYYMETSVKRQFEPLKQGFYKVLGSNALTLFRPEEIELLIRGSDEALDIPALRAVTRYKHWKPFYEDNHAAADRAPVVEWFWRYFSSLDPASQRKLLMFVTGSDRVPATGMATMTFKITRLGDDSDRFPVAHTCFNELCLYEYKSKYKLVQLLSRAINESEGFGLR